MNCRDIKKGYDLVIVGGGITGAGVFFKACQLGLKPLLVEAKDFAWGTSSRSSKMVHGGLRYLKQGRFLLTRSAVKERQRLLKTYPGLVIPLNFIMPIFDNHGPSRFSMKLGLFVYSLMAGEKQNCKFSRQRTLELVPGMCMENLNSAVGFKDAQVDDARLVLRMILDGCDMGGQAFNYTRAKGLERNQKGQIAAVNLEDSETGHGVQVETRVVINATGAFAEALHPSPVKGFHIRPLRGSHLVFPGKLLPLDRVISFIHPQDSRAVFIFPWEGSVFLGTTEVDHEPDIHEEPRVSMAEADYLLDGLKFIFPNTKITLQDCIASFAGVRPILSRKKLAASKESREHVVWKDKGLVTVTGGKLTTFGLLARDALREAGNYLPDPSKKRLKNILSHRFGPDPDLADLAGKDLSDSTLLRVRGRYGSRARQVFASCDPDLFSCINDSQTLWAELCHGAGSEQIRHLSDLLLRRVRIGLFFPQGGADLLDRIQELVSPHLSWDATRWEKEKQDYVNLWQRCYAPPSSALEDENKQGGIE